MEDNSIFTLENPKLEKSSVYICPVCKRKYVHLSTVPNNEIIKFFNDEYINIAPNNRTSSNDEEKRIISTTTTTKDKKTEIDLSDFYKTAALLLPSSDIRKRFQKPYCSKCGSVLSQSKIRISSRKKRVVLLAQKCNYCGRFYVPAHIYSEFGGKEPKSLATIKEIRDYPKEQTAIKTYIDTTKKDYDVTGYDFVVRLSVLKCRNKNHQLQDIQASIITVSRLGTISKIKVPAGYCPACKMFFIMDNIYRRIRSSGIPICRVMDEKTYNEEGFGNSGRERSKITSYDRLAHESVLRQFGYSVNQVDDLTAVQRHNILAAMVDYKVLTKTEIISYLEYFINNRKNQRNKDGSYRYAVAVDRWREDREWISGYKTGSFKEVAVKRIITN